MNKNENVVLPSFESLLQSINSKEKCICSLGRESKSSCLPAFYFKPGHLSLIILGIDDNIFSVVLKENTTEITTQNEIKIIPNENVFLLRNQLKDNFERFGSGNFLNKYKTVSKHHRAIICNHNDFPHCKMLSFQNNNDVSLINVSLLTDSKRKKSLRLENVEIIDAFSWNINPETAREKKRLLKKTILSNKKRKISKD